MVRKGYRDPPYHNWSHAFAVLHFCYLLFKNTKVLSLIRLEMSKSIKMALNLINLINYCSLHIHSELDAFSLFVSCLCHDIDHRGTTNSFQVASVSALLALEL